MKKGIHKRSKNSEFQDKCRKTKNRWNRSVRAITHATVNGNRSRSRKAKWLRGLVRGAALKIPS